MKIDKILTLSAGILVLLSSSSCRKDSEGQPRGARIRVDVRTDSVSVRSIYRRKTFTGVMEPYQKAGLAPNPPGTVKRLYCKVGDRVRKGQNLAKMDDAVLVQTIARFQPVKTQYEQSQQLYAKGAVSKSQFDSIESRYLAMKRQVASLQENTVLKAPFSGVVTHVAVEEGEWYSPQMTVAIPGGGGRGLVEVARLNPLKIDLDIDDKTVALIARDMDVAVHTDAIPDTTFRGAVLWVNPLARSSSRTFEVRVLVPNPAHTLKAGYFAEVDIVTERRDSVLAVPSSAILHQDRLFVVQDSLALSRRIETGWRADGYVEVLSGLAQGERVIVEGNRALPDSALVRVGR